MSKILLVGIGGFLGAVFRFGISTGIRSYFMHPFPLATLFVNFLGCLGIGLLFELFRNHSLLPTLSLLVAVGFLGSFTTFSAFSFETMDLVKRGNHQLASLYVLASLLFCFVGVVGGELLGKELRQ